MKALFVCAGEGDKLCLLSLTLLFPSISSYLDKADWFLKADDDTYVIVENMRLLLSRFSPDKPVYLGRRFRRFVHQGYMSGGAGYVLSRESEMLRQGPAPWNLHPVHLCRGPTTGLLPPEAGSPGRGL